jgi:acetolactate synthase regulatory subunit
MTDTLHLALDQIEGALPRVIGLIERRGFIIDALDMRTGSAGRILSLTVRARDASRRIDVLTRQLDRLHGLRRMPHAQ